MSTPTWTTDDTPLDKPNLARIYDYLLGGYHNFEIDRQVADQTAEFFPEVKLAAQANRAFLRRAVKFVCEQGIDQFLDIGSGIPTVGNVHEVAQAANPAARVVYVDIDPIAVAHSRAMLRDNPNAAAIRGDVRLPEQILDHPETRRLLDFSRPVAVLLVAVLHWVTDDEEAYRSVRTLRDALVPGSYLIMGHNTMDGVPRDVAERAHAIAQREVSPTRYRSAKEIRRFFDGFELLEPGIVYLSLWRPDEPDGVLLDQPERSLNFACVGRRV